MSYAPGRRLPPPRPYGVRTAVPRPYYGVRPPVVVPSASSGILSGTLGAVGGTLGCLLCLSAIGALGLFSCVVAITAYTKKFLDAYKQVSGITNTSASAQLQIGFALMIASLFYVVINRMQRS